MDKKQATTYIADTSDHEEIYIARQFDFICDGCGRKVEHLFIRWVTGEHDPLFLCGGCSVVFTKLQKLTSQEMAILLAGSGAVAREKSLVVV